MGIKYYKNVCSDAATYTTNKTFALIIARAQRNNYKNKKLKTTTDDDHSQNGTKNFEFNWKSFEV